MKMSLDSSGVKRGLASAKDGVKKFAAKAGSLLKAGMAGLVAIAVAGFAAATRSAINYGKEMQNLAKLANTGFKEFQKMAEGAKTVGVQQDKLADILKDTSDKIGDFLETGGGAMADYFENIAPLIGQTAEEFRGLSGADALQKYYDGLQQANLDQETMTFYMEAIASDSAALIPLLHDGGSAFKSLGQEAEDAGRIMSEDTAKRMAVLGKAWDNLKQKMTIKAGELITLIQTYNDIPDITPIDYGAVSTRGLARQDEVAKMKELAAAYGELPTGTDLKGLAEGISDVATQQDTFLTTGFDPSKLKGAEKALAAASAEIAHQQKLLADNVITQEDYNFQHGIILDMLKLEGNEIRKTQRTEKEKASIAKLKASLAESEAAAALDSMTTSEKLASLMAARVKLQQELVDGGNGSAKAEKELLEHKIKVSELDRDIKEATEAANKEHETAMKKGDAASAKGAAKAIADQKKADKAHKEAVEAAEAKVAEGLQSDLLDAQVAQRADVVHSIEKEIELTERIKQIREETGKNEAQARQAAEAMMKIEAGADLNQSGFVTPMEQRKWNREQKELAREQKKINREEQRAERERGGNIKKALGGREAAEARANERREQANKRELDRRRRRGEKAEDVLKEFAERKLKKEDEVAKKQGKEAVANLKKAREEAKAAKGKAAKKPGNAVVDGLKPTLEKQLAELVKINKALKCEG